MITITRTRITVAAGLLAASALAGGTAVAVAAVAPSHMYDHAPVANIYHGAPPANVYEHGVLANIGHGAPPASVQVSSVYSGAPPASASGI